MRRGARRRRRARCGPRRSPLTRQPRRRVGRAEDKLRRVATQLEEVALGERVPVMGDEGHNADYRRIAQDLGGSCPFQLGLPAGPQLQPALTWARVAVDVAVWAFAHGAGSSATGRAGGAGGGGSSAEGFRPAMVGWSAARGPSARPRTAAGRGGQGRAARVVWSGPDRLVGGGRIVQALSRSL